MDKRLYSMQCCNSRAAAQLKHTMHHRRTRSRSAGHGCCQAAGCKSVLLLEAARQLTLYTCCTTNWPRMHISRSFVNFKLILRRTATAKRPKTAPEAPRQTLLWGIDSHEAKLPPAWGDESAVSFAM